MAIALIMVWVFGWQTSAIMVKRELTRDGAYFCRVDDSRIKRCYDVKVTEDESARDEVSYKR